MRAWWELYKKELNSNLFVMLVVFLLVLAWQVFLFYKSSTWPEGLPFGLSFLPLSFFPLLILYMGYNAYKQEWKDDTNYFLLSLPRYGWQISLAKLAAAMTFFTVVSLGTHILIYIFQHSFIQRALLDIPGNLDYSSLLWGIGIKIFIVYLLTGLAIYILAQFSQIVSLFFDRFRGLISIVVFILSNYLVFRLGSFLAPLLGWLPDIPIENVQVLDGQINSFVFYLGSGPFVGLLLMLITLFLLASWILETQLEV